MKCHKYYHKVVFVNAEKIAATQRVHDNLTDHYILFSLKGNLDSFVERKCEIVEATYEIAPCFKICNN